EQVLWHDGTPDGFAYAGGGPSPAFCHYNEQAAIVRTPAREKKTRPIRFAQLVQPVLPLLGAWVYLSFCSGLDISPLPKGMFRQSIDRPACLVTIEVGILGAVAGASCQWLPRRSRTSSITSVALWRPLNPGIGAIVNCSRISLVVEMKPPSLRWSAATAQW